MSEAAPGRMRDELDSWGVEAFKDLIDSNPPNTVRWFQANAARANLMAPKTRAKSAKAGTEHPNPKRIKSNLDIQTREDDSRNTKRCRHCGAPLRSEDNQDMETTLQDTGNAAANVSSGPLDFIEPVDPRESAEVPSPVVLPEWNGRRRRSGLRSGLLTRDELGVADFLDVLVAAATMVQLAEEGSN